VSEDKDGIFSPDVVRAHLTPLGIEVLELPDNTSTAVLAAAALDTEVGAIVKSLLFFAGVEPVLALAAGNRTVSLSRLAAVTRADQVRLAKPREVLAFTGYAVGGVPPVAHREKVRVVMDRGLLDKSRVWAAAGSPYAVFGVSPERLRVIAGAELHDIVE
jgi:prolyl-tRNA editing enzyme YbaK/EbsC (Cys-tRNA(Pro) deacylase)